MGILYITTIYQPDTKKISTKIFEDRKEFDEASLAADKKGYEMEVFFAFTANNLEEWKQKDTLRKNAYRSNRINDALTPIFDHLGKLYKELDNTIISNKRNPKLLEPICKDDLGIHLYNFLKEISQVDKEFDIWTLQQLFEWKSIKALEDDGIIKEHIIILQKLAKELGYRWE